jgi:multidrug efflux pump subunit AcrA (membrane-fusion protein)
MRRRVIGWGAAILILLVSAGCGSGGAQPAAEQPAVTVQTEPATVGAIRETVSISGEVAAGSEVQVLPKLAGRITRVAVTMGQEVDKGELLVELDAQELSLAVRQAEAALEMARANLQSARAGGTLAQLQAATRQAEANYKNAGKTLERMEMLYREGAISLQQLEAVRLQAAVAESQHSLAGEQLAIFERGEGQIQVLAAQVRQAEATLDMARLNLSHTRITSPVAGKVLSLNAEVGNMASPAQPAAILLGPEGVTVIARVTEQSVGLFSQGQSVEVEVPATGTVVSGKVREVAPGAVAGTKSFLVRVRVAEAKGIRPGMFARVMLAVAENTAAVLLPRAALLEQDGRHFVFTVKEGKAERREVTVGLQDERFAEITSGVTAGETVITAGQHFLQEGAAVREEGESNS